MQITRIQESLTLRSFIVATEHFFYCIPYFVKRIWIDWPKVQIGRINFHATHTNPEHEFHNFTLISVLLVFSFCSFSLWFTSLPIIFISFVWFTGAFLCFGCCCCCCFLLLLLIRSYQLNNWAMWLLYLSSVVFFSINTLKMINACALISFVVDSLLFLSQFCVFFFLQFYYTISLI